MAADSQPQPNRKPTAPKPTPADVPTSTYTPASSPKIKISIPGYRLVREISRGGQGAVFEGIRTSTDRRCAIKVLAGGALSNPRERARFDQEAKILGALDHPNIVRVLDRGTAADGSLFLVMDYISGRPLSKVIADGGPRPADAKRDPSESLRLFLKIADAVSAAHLRGIVHRDLKPANILIDDHGEPHILDFGLARTGLLRYTDEPNPEPVTITGQFLGSLPWSSPEQADGNVDKVDIRTDVYSLGVILYQLLTGEFPYEVAGTMRDVLNNIILVEPAPPSRVLEARAARDQRRRIRRTNASAGKLNPVIDAIVLKALAKRREDRYQSAGELARDIGNYLSGRPTLAAGDAPRRPLEPWVIAAVSASAALIVLIIAIALLIRHNRSTAPLATPTPTTPQPAVQPTPAIAKPVAQPIPTPTVVATEPPVSQPPPTPPARQFVEPLAQSVQSPAAEDRPYQPRPFRPRADGTTTHPSPDQFLPPPPDDQQPDDANGQPGTARRRPAPPPPEDDPLGLGPAGRNRRPAPPRPEDDPLHLGPGHEPDPQTGAPTNTQPDPRNPPRRRPDQSRNDGPPGADRPPPPPPRSDRGDDNPPPPPSDRPR